MRCLTARTMLKEAERLYHESLSSLDLLNQRPSGVNGHPVRTAEMLSTVAKLYKRLSRPIDMSSGASTASHGIARNQASIVRSPWVTRLLNEIDKPPRGG